MYLNCAILFFAIMNDSDNTGEHSVPYLDCIEVYREMGNDDS